jgi:hypothetical protein
MEKLRARTCVYIALNVERRVENIPTHSHTNTSANTHIQALAIFAGIFSPFKMIS